MENNRISDQSRINPELTFMLKKCSCSYSPMAYWLTVPEFETELLEMNQNGIEIRDDTILPVMQRIYDQKIHERRELRKSGIQSDFKFGYARTGLSCIKRAVESATH